MDDKLIGLLLIYPVLVFSAIVHEYFHGWAAEKHGDNTARVMGRLTFNPIPHLDPIGTVGLPLFFLLTGAPVFFAWAKPVPINPLKLSRRGLLWTSLAGVISNFALAILFSGAFYAMLATGLIPPSDRISQLFFIYAIRINLLLAVFNLMPVPPLDGSRVLALILPYRAAVWYEDLERRFGVMLVIILAAMGVFGYVMRPIINVLTKVVMFYY